MKKENNALYILRLAVTLLAICAAVALALAGVNAITKDRIAAIQAEKTQKAIAEVMELHGDGTVTEVEFTDTTGLVKRVYRSEGYFNTCLIDGTLAYDYAVEVTPAGFNGEITMMVGVDPEGRVIDICVVSHTETAGLGAVAASSGSAGTAFRQQFVGAAGEVKVTKEGGTVDAITGATVTSRAVCNGVNAALSCVAVLEQGGAK